MQAVSCAIFLKKTLLIVLCTFCLRTYLVMLQVLHSRFRNLCTNSFELSCSFKFSLVFLSCTVLTLEMDRHTWIGSILDCQSYPMNLNSCGRTQCMQTFDFLLFIQFSGENSFHSSSQPFGSASFPGKHWFCIYFHLKCQVVVFFLFPS